MFRTVYIKINQQTSQVHVCPRYGVIVIVSRVRALSDGRLERFFFSLFFLINFLILLLYSKVVDNVGFEYIYIYMCVCV